MKKTIIATLIAISGISNAQNIEGGIKVGYTNSNIIIKGSNQKIKLPAMSNIYLGAYQEYKINKHISIHGEIAIAGIGTSESPLDNSQGSLNIVLAYIPIGVKLYPIPNNKVSINTGINIGFNTGVYGKEYGTKVKYTNFSKGNHSYYAGIEYKITDKILTEIKYSSGINNIFKQVGVKMNNNFLQIGIGYRIQ